MTDYLLTAALLTLLFLVVIITRNSDSSKATFFSKKYTTALKGVCSIVVIFIHIPDAYQNPLQENVGRFAYIAVTLFFMISAYGMQLGLRKPCYLKHFWRNRLSSLLIPCLVVNLTWFCFSVGTTGSPEWLSLLSINDYVKQLIGYCAIFYIVYRLEQGGGVHGQTGIYTMPARIYRQYNPVFYRFRVASAEPRLNIRITVSPA